MCSTCVFPGYSYLFRHIEFWQEKGANGTCVKWKNFLANYKKRLVVFTTVKKETNGMF